MTQTLDLINRLKAARAVFNNEDGLQNWLADFLTALKIPFEREVIVGQRRIDFAIWPCKGQGKFAGALGIECKVAGGSAAVSKQLAYYAPHFRALLLLTTKPLTVPAAFYPDRETCLVFTADLWRNL